MSKLSYSQKTKQAILAAPVKKKCCSRILDDILRLENESDSDMIVSGILGAPEHFKCPGCFGHFAAGLFIVFGTVTDPLKSYHLELSFDTSAQRDAANHVLSDKGVHMRASERYGRNNKRSILYIKDSSAIEDFFALIGANKAAFELMNSKIVRGLRQDANRQMNCDMANINKSLNAARECADVIREMNDADLLIQLPAELRITAVLRMENPQASLTELGALHSPPISKSGVKHRLDKVMEAAKYITEKQ